MNDLELLAQIYVASFREQPWCEEYALSEVLHVFDTVLSWPETMFLIERNVDNRPVGAVIGFSATRKLWLQKHFNSECVQRSFYLSEIFIDPHARGQGISRRLLTKVIYDAQKAGFAEMCAATSVHQRIIRHMLVDCFGFQEILEESYQSTRARENAAKPMRRVLFHRVL